MADAPPHGRSPAPRPGFLLIVSGPSGVGKSSLVNALLPRIDADLSISKTTREPTPNDVHGEHYFFVDVESFKRDIEAGELLEHAVYNEQFYGTPRAFVEKKLAAGRVVILEIDVEGARQVKQAMPEAFAVFIDPPSEGTLLQRLRDRRREDEAKIQKRLSLAKKEIAFAHRSELYDAFVVNDDFDRALTQLEHLIRDRLSQNESLFD